MSAPPPSSVSVSAEEAARLALWIASRCRMLSGAIAEETVIVLTREDGRIAQGLARMCTEWEVHVQRIAPYRQGRRP